MLALYERRPQYLAPLLAPDSSIALTNAPAVGAATMNDTYLASFTYAILYAYPIAVPHTITSTYVGFYVSAAVTTQYIHLALYADEGVKPGRRLVAASSVNFSPASAVKWVAWNSSITLQPGLYWIGASSNEDDYDAASVRAHREGELRPMFGVAPGTSGYPRQYATRSFSYGACPDPWGTVSTWNTSSKQAAFWLY